MQKEGDFMANNRAKQVERYSTTTGASAGAGADPLRLISDAVFERITDESRPAPSCMNALAMQIVKDNPELSHLSAAEKEFFRKALNSALSGDELTADEFYDRIKE